MQTETTPKAGINFLVIFLSLFVCLFLVAALGFGIWGYQLGTNLATVQAEEAELQASYDALAADKNTATSALTQAKTDLDAAKASLEQAKADLASTQAKLATSQETATAYQERIAKAQKYLNVLIVYYIDVARFDSLSDEVREVEDPELEEVYDRALASGTNQDFFDWLSHLFDTTADLLRVE